MKRKRTLEQKQADTPIASMIDIVFLLIIFFVVTATIDKEIHDEKINLATAPRGKPLTHMPTPSVVINVRENGKANMGGVEMERHEISSLLRTMAANHGNDLPIIIRGDKNTQHEYIRKVMDSITDTGLHNVRLTAIAGGGVE